MDEENNDEKKILIHFNRFSFGTTPESLSFSQNKRYIVFLNGTAGYETASPGADSMPMYRLLDRWLSVQPYAWHLLREIKQFVKTEEEVQQAAARNALTRVPCDMDKPLLAGAQADAQARDSGETRPQRARPVPMDIR